MAVVTATVADKVMAAIKGNGKLGTHGKKKKKGRGNPGKLLKSF